MKPKKLLVMGINAPPARPNAGGFLVLGVILSAPVAVLGFGVDLIWRWYL